MKIYIEAKSSTYYTTYKIEKDCIGMAGLIELGSLFQFKIRLIQINSLLNGEVALLK